MTVCHCTAIAFGEHQVWRVAAVAPPTTMVATCRHAELAATAATAVATAATAATSACVCLACRLARVGQRVLAQQREAIDAAVVGCSQARGKLTALTGAS